MQPAAQMRWALQHDHSSAQISQQPAHPHLVAGRDADLNCPHQVAALAPRASSRPGCAAACRRQLVTMGSP